MRPHQIRAVLPVIADENVWAGELPTVRIRGGSMIYYTDLKTYQKVTKYLKNPRKICKDWSVNGQTFYEMRKGGIIKTEIYGYNGKISVSEGTDRKLKKGLRKIIFNQ